MGPQQVLLEIRPDADTVLDSARPDTPLGASHTLTVGYAVGPARSSTRALLRFSLAGVPPDNRIVAARLVLDTVAVAGQSEVWLWQGRVTEPWAESDATWSHQPAIQADRPVLVGPSLDDLTLDVTRAVDEGWHGAGSNVDIALWVAEDECDAGRTRSFGSSDSGRSPRLQVSFISPGTPHPFPSPTSTVLPTATATPSGTLPPTPSPTTTSTSGQNHGQAELVRPAEAARLWQPMGDEAWVFEWYPPSNGTCSYTGARLTLISPMGVIIIRDVTGTCYRFAADRPVTLGRWTWWIMARCALGRTSPSERRSFVVVVDPDAPTPTVTAGLTRTATALPSRTPSGRATAVPAYMPIAVRPAVVARH